MMNFKVDPKLNTAVNDNAQLTAINDNAQLMAYFKQRDADMKQSAEDLVTKMSHTNVDLHNIGRYNWASKNIKIGGKLFQVMIHTDDSVCSALEKMTDFTVGAVFQIWNGWTSTKSVIIPISKANLEDARKNWCDEYIIDADDTVTQAVSALLLNTDVMVEAEIAKKCAYENDGVDGDACAQVWD